MNTTLDSKKFPAHSPAEDKSLNESLAAILNDDYHGSFISLFSAYKRILGDNRERKQWNTIHEKLLTLFKCGSYTPLDGPMIGISLSIRDTDYFRKTAEFFGKERSAIANIEWMASCWNTTFANSGMWMGKTFEPVKREVVTQKCDNNPLLMKAYDKSVTRIGRNFFRDPHNPTLLQLAGIPALTPLWNLSDRPLSPGANGFDSDLLQENLTKEKNIPYTKTGGLFLANSGVSVLEDMNKKAVYQLNYRWPGLNPVYPMTRLVDELVQIDEGVYLGQLVMATKQYSLGTLKLSFLPGDFETQIGEAYSPGQDRKGWLNFLLSLFSKKKRTVDYGYQNNGFFLMIDPALAKQAYADDAFPYCRPHPGEMGYKELGFDKTPPCHDTGVMHTTGAKSSDLHRIRNWVSGWKENEALHKKFTTFCQEPSPRDTDTEDVQKMLQEGESILQMLQRIKDEISKQTKPDDQIEHFEKLNRLFRSGVAPQVKNGFFQGVNGGYNTRLDCLPDREWYGGKEPCLGFDYYHGATLNLHCGFSDTFCPDMTKTIEESHLFPPAIASLLKEDGNTPNLLNIFWANIGRFIFPWAGKSFEKISGRKLSMLLDESSNLEERYPERVKELLRYPASWPHYNLVQKNEQHHWKQSGPFTEHLKSGSWDRGMTDEDKDFWHNEANQHWIFGNNIQDSRVIAADPLMRMLDMNYRIPDQPLLDLAESGPSPFARQGYIFLGTSDRESILPMNNGENRKKKVFQFHYRYPLIGGPVPIGTCLDELVEIAQGLYLGQLIYSTLPLVPFNSSVDPAEYQYQLFGYFLLLDNDWEYHRQAIKLDTI